MSLNFRFTIDDSLPCRHIFVCGTTGSGKSTYLKNNKLIGDAKRVVIWDPDGSHDVPAGCQCGSVKEFKQKLGDALRSGKSFRLSCKVSNSKNLFQAFCAVVVRHASSDTPMVTMVEEVQEVTGNAEAVGYWSNLLSRARKYGVSLVVISPRPQQCDKTTVTSCPKKVVCLLGTHKDRVAMASEIGVTAEDLRKIGSLNDQGKKLHWYEADAGGLPRLVEHTF